MNPTTLSFWAKTWREDVLPAEGQVDWKPVAHHLIDVAAAAEAIQAAAPSRLERDAAFLKCSTSELAAVSAYLVGLHDIGKFSRAFQRLSPKHWPAAPLGPFEEAPSIKHWRLSQALLTGPLEDLLAKLAPSMPPSDLIAVAAAVAGHHGEPPRQDDSALPQNKRRNAIGEAAITAARDAMETLWSTLGQPRISVDPDDEWVARFCWRLAGLATLSDWVGSDSRYFSFKDPALSAEAYWPAAREAAIRAVRDKGLTSAEPEPFGGVQKLFPAISTPRPMQAMTESVDLPDGPILAVIEDATGAGKT